MKFIDKRAKLIGTIGPSSETEEILKQLVLNGLTTIRTNFSHGTREEQQKKFLLAKKISKDLNIPISIMLDTKGPEIRVGKMKNGAQLISENSIVTIFTSEQKYREFEGSSTEVTVSYEMDVDLKVGDTVLFDDGKLTTKVIDVQKGKITVKAINNHLLKTNKRINLPGINFSLPFLAEKDRGDIEFGVKNGIDFIAASFVNSEENVKELKALLKKLGATNIKIFSKIESEIGIKNIDSIIKESDGIMIARGDLGLEIPYYDVPFHQKRIIRKCREVGKPVIVATQMLDSMEKSPQPTRAEVTDVYWATELGADATMLSGESASGDFPVEAVKVMATINKRAEKEFYNKLYYPVQMEQVYKNSIKDSRNKIAYNIVKQTQNGKYKYVVVRSKTGKLLETIAKYRPNAAIIGIVDDADLITKFGVTNSVIISMDSISLYGRIKEDFDTAREALTPFFPNKGDYFLVADQHKTEEKIY